MKVATECRGAGTVSRNVSTANAFVPTPFAFALREGRSNAHIGGNYQRIGDVLLKNVQGMKVSCFGTGWDVP